MTSNGNFSLFNRSGRRIWYYSGSSIILASQRYSGIYTVLILFPFVLHSGWTLRGVFLHSAVVSELSTGLGVAVWWVLAEYEF